MGCRLRKPTKLLPTTVKLFASNDQAIRVGLLQLIGQFGESLCTQIVDEQVLPHVATGFSDTSAFLRELTLKSMLVLAPKVHAYYNFGPLSREVLDDAIVSNSMLIFGTIRDLFLAFMLELPAAFLKWIQFLGFRLFEVAAAVAVFVTEKIQTVDFNKVVSSCAMYKRREF
ncbi:hypothetical protein AAC387_Pa06g1189 [Persea americana]